MLGCAVLTHSYAIFALGALVLAELVRTFLNRRWNWHFVIVIVFSLMALFILIDPTRKGFAIGSRATYYTMWSIATFYGALLEPMTTELALLMALGVLAGFVLTASPGDSKEPAWTEVPNLSACMTLAAALSLLPLLIVPLSSIFKAPFLFRYSIASGIGFALVTALLVYLLRGWRGALPLISLSIIGAGFVLHEMRIVSHFARNPRPTPDRTAFEDPEAKSLPVFAQDPYLYVEMLFTWPKDRIANLHYVLDYDISDRILGRETVDANVAQMAPAKKMQLESYAELRRLRRQFLLYYDTSIDRDEIKGWLLKQLLDDHTPIQLLRRHDDILVYLVTIPGAS
jgi:hypothetical protein